MFSIIDYELLLPIFCSFETLFSILAEKEFPKPVDSAVGQFSTVEEDGRIVILVEHRGKCKRR